MRPSRSGCSPWSPRSILAISGASVLVEEDPPSLAERIVRLVGYFTIQANVLVAATRLHPGPQSGPGRPRLAGGPVAAVVGITVTRIVHWFFLRPLLDLAGWSYLCDKLLHVVVPLLAVARLAVLRTAAAGDPRSWSCWP